MEQNIKGSRKNLKNIKLFLEISRKKQVGLINKNSDEGIATGSLGNKWQKCL